jgi:hypothetical protein
MTIISLKEAKAAVRKERIAMEKEYERYSPVAKLNMRADARDLLGALFHVYASQVGEPVDDSVFGIVYHVNTSAGIFKTHYDPHFGAIFGRFEDPTVAKDRLSDVNPYSGKWNTHTSKGDDPEEVFEGWRRQLDAMRQI